MKKVIRRKMNGLEFDKGGYSMKKIICLILAWILVFCLVGCNNTSSNTTDEGETSSDTTDSEDDNPPKKTGFYKSNLYLIKDGKTSIYDRYAGGTSGLTPKDVLDTFETETKYEGIIWNVYSTEEYPNLSYVLVISGTNAKWTYHISDSNQ